MGNGIFLIEENKYYILRKNVYYMFGNERSERSIYTEIPLLIKISKIFVEDDRFCIFFNSFTDSQTIYWMFTDTLNSFVEINDAISNYLDTNIPFFGEYRDLVDACVREHDEFISYNKEIQNYLE